LEGERANVSKTGTALRKAGPDFKEERGQTFGGENLEKNETSTWPGGEMGGREQTDKSKKSVRRGKSPREVAMGGGVGRDAGLGGLQLGV